MKTNIITIAIAAATWGAVVHAIRQNEKRYYNRKMAMMDEFFDKNPHR